MRPVVRPHRPLRIRRVPSIPREPRGQLEEAAVRDGVFIAVPVVEGVDLPAQAAAAGVGVPAQRLRVEHGLREREPVRCARRRVWEVLLGRGDHCEAPETLVVVALRCVVSGGCECVCGAANQRFGLVRWHVVPVWPHLVQQRLGHDGIVACVAGVVPVVDERLSMSAGGSNREGERGERGSVCPPGERGRGRAGTRHPSTHPKHSARLPPIIRIPKQAWNPIRLIPRIHLHHLIRDALGHIQHGF